MHQIDGQAMYLNTLNAMQKLVHAQALTIQKVEMDRDEARNDTRVYMARHAKEMEALKEAKKQLRAVKNLHKRSKIKHECSDDDCLICAQPECATCRRNWPCPTYQAAITDADV